MSMRVGFEYLRRGVSFTVLGLALTLFLAACASAPGRMTQAVLDGDIETLDGLLVPGSSEINMPLTLKMATPTCPDQKIMTPLQAAACTGQESVIRKLLAGKADIDLSTGAGQTPLMLAIAYGRNSAARLLVESGAKLEGTDTVGNTPLLLAAARGDRALAEFLLKNGASPTARNRAGDTALLLSAEAGLSRMLVALGADPLAVNAERESGLHLAAKTGNAQIAKFFLERGVDVGLRNRGGASALDLVRVSGVASASETAQVTLAARRRGLPSSSGNRTMAPIASVSSERREEVALVIENWIDQLVRKETAAANQAAQEGRSAEALTLYAAALAKVADTGGTANDLRTKIIRYAASLPQPPVFPEKAREHLVRSSYLLKKGQDIVLVENEIVAALHYAPWWVEGYYNLGQLQAEQGKFDVAERNLKLFIEAVPADPRVQAAQDKIYETRMAREENEKLHGMAGRWIDGKRRGYNTVIKGDKILISSDAGLVFTLTTKNGALDGTVEGRASAGAHGCTIPAQMHPITGRLSPDARSITLEYLWSRYKTSYHCVNMAGVPSNCCLFCDEVCDAVTVSGSDRMSLQLRPAR
jgi:tetratricopeptide (TPR) repeat protein